VLLAGTDVTNPVFRVAALLSVQLIVFMVAVRTVTTRRLRRVLRASNPAGSTIDAERARRLADLQRRRTEAPRVPTGAASGADVDAHPDVDVDADADVGAEITLVADEPATAAVDPAIAERVAALAARRNAARAGSGSR
jgi:hypothetical protein